jgi:ketosteroid isomerase-like protein
MKWMFAILMFSLSFLASAQEKQEVSGRQVEELIEKVNLAQNKVMMRNSTPQDIEALFAMYSDDFTYVHAAYGGNYSRETLLGNTVRIQKAGRYNLDEGRYKILRVITGLNGAAIERMENKSGKIHLSVFEFKDGKVSKITEYWK